MIKNVDSSGERVVVRGERSGNIIFYNYLDDDDCVVESIGPDTRLLIELEKKS